MTSFLDNPEERIGSFNSSLDRRLNIDETRDGNTPAPVSHPKKKRFKKSIEQGDNQEKKSVQIRISQDIEQKIREILLETYKKTGRKIKFREYADEALLAFISSFERDFH